MKWIEKEFEQLTVHELYAILKERVDVFVVEQNCAYPEIDNYDQVATHMFLIDEGEIKAYCRLLPSGSKYEEASIGRVLVKEKYRGKGYAIQLMERAVNIMMKEWNEKTIKLQAQAHLSNFYAQFGFEVKSDEYMDDGIPHVDMISSQDYLG
ncbi:ElaA protein [Salirhabdus euzebyi]|uniref:ElaA protein n=1 Tax=Salirhabdus euzebyi TaxID=394506 RepID=A0A841Q6R8_9BACI|nr:GNAT family N-acetyltransferase [Salirhabdus euzebyi]MBB6454098.1 ElaA protein [Salirhabdus euzebyi]